MDRAILSLFDNSRFLLLGTLLWAVLGSLSPADLRATPPWQSDESQVDTTYQDRDKRLAGLSAEQLREEYDAALSEWKHQHARLIQAHYMFFNVREGESEYWAMQFRDAKKHGERARKLAGHLAVNLMEKLTEPPDRDLADMVFNSMDAHLLFFEYQKAHRTAKALVESGHQRPYLLPMYAYSAYCVNEFAEARSVFIQSQIVGETLTPDQQAAFDACSVGLSQLEKERTARATDEEANLPRVELMTTRGPIVVELFEDQAPNTVANFIFLVERNFFREHQFYDIDDSLAITGSPTNDASGRVDYSIRSEHDREDRRAHLRGYLTLMIDVNSELGSSQFSILTRPRPDLDNSLNTVFGRIIEGEIVLDLLERSGSTWENMIKAADSQIGPPDKIISARVLRKRDHRYLPERIAY